MLKTSIVIPAYNGLPYLKKNLPSVLKLNPDEVIIIDDASSDETPAYLRNNYPQIKIFRQKTNQRFPKSANTGFKMATGDIVILLNQDLSPDPNLIRSILPHFSNEKVFAVTFNEQGRSWARVKFSAGFIEFKNGFLDKQPHLSFWASGGSAAFRRSVWQKLGGFDPVFTPGYFEDFDIGFRAYKRGYKIIWEPKALVDHETETSFNQVFSPRQLVRIKERNFLISLWKNLDTANLARHFGAVISRIFKTPGYLRSVLMAVPLLPYIISFRVAEQKHIKVSDAAIFQQIENGLK